ncbi:hypothetical protein Mbo2_061 [Rhodococcus phage Mbo2]|uniref:Uncharacterized protein n=1 Tax=Rhodococcus phage Mbo2 TaxID=2936911 RepID=A0A9E7IPM3_9CAUD|nr:hypothetical protein Mbo2_061 [Rhodococcus phage Mbo2]
MDSIRCNIIFTDASGPHAPSWINCSAVPTKGDLIDYKGRFVTVDSVVWKIDRHQGVYAPNIRCS